MKFKINEINGANGREEGEKVVVVHHMLNAFITLPLEFLPCHDECLIKT